MLGRLPWSLRYILLALFMLGLFAVLHQAAWQAGWEVAILPNASSERHGFRAETLPVEGWLLATAKTKYWDSSHGFMEHQEGSTRAFAIMNLPESGQYRFSMGGQGWARVFIGPEERIQGVLSREAPASFTAELPAGPHLLVLELEKTTGESELELTLTGPGQAEPMVLRDAWLSYPDLANIEMYWWIIYLSQSAWFIICFTAVVCLGLHGLRKGWQRSIPRALARWSMQCWRHPAGRRAMVYAVVFLGLLSGFGHLQHIFGDESSYMITSMSMTRDLDFNMLNNYERGDYLHFSNQVVKPQVLIINGFVPPEHGIGFPILITPAFEALGVIGVRLFLILLGLFSAVLAGEFCGLLGYSRRVGDAAGLLVCLSPTWLMHANRIFPEVSAGFLLILTLVLVERFSRQERLSRGRGLLLGILVGYFPLLYLKYTLLGMTVGAYCLIKRQVRTQWTFYAGVILLLGFFLITWLSIYGDNFGVGTGGGSHDFSRLNSLMRFWRPWLDRTHGLLVLQPAYGLFFLAALPLLVKGFVKGPRWLICGVLGCLAYAYMYGLFIPSPGDSWPGRFLCAIIPVLSVMISIWAWRKGAPLWRRGAFVILAALGAWHSLVVALYGLTTTKAAAEWYLHLFVPYWSSGKEFQPPRGVELLIWVLGLAVLAMVVDHLWQKRKTTN
jgi:hypothetical protein